MYEIRTKCNKRQLCLCDMFGIINKHVYIKQFFCYLYEFNLGKIKDLVERTQQLRSFL